jgi:hypothetical protein
MTRLTAVVDGLAARDAEAPEDPGAVVAVEVAPPRRGGGTAAVDVSARDGAIAAGVAVDLNGPDKRAGAIQP